MGKIHFAAAGRWFIIWDVPGCCLRPLHGAPSHFLYGLDIMQKNGGEVPLWDSPIWLCRFSNPSYWVGLQGRQRETHRFGGPLFLRDTHGPDACRGCFVRVVLAGSSETCGTPKATNTAQALSFPSIRVCAKIGKLEARMAWKTRSPLCLSIKWQLH